MCGIDFSYDLHGDCGTCYFVETWTWTENGHDEETFISINTLPVRWGGDTGMIYDVLWGNENGDAGAKKKVRDFQ